MPRTFSVPEHLLRDAAKAAKDAKLLDELCEVAVGAIRPVLAESLKRRTAEEGAVASLAEAEAAIQLLLKEGQETAEMEGPPPLEVLRSLSKVLASDIKELDAKVVAERASELGRTMMSTWIDLLATAGRQSTIQILADDLLPPNLGAAAIDDWREAIHPMEVRPADGALIMRAVHEALLKRVPLDLPLGLRLARVSSTSRTLMATTASRPVDSSKVQRVIPELIDKLTRKVREIFPLLPSAAEAAPGFVTCFSFHEQWHYTREIEEMLITIAGVDAVEVVPESNRDILHIAYCSELGRRSRRNPIERELRGCALKLGFSAEIVAVAELPRETFQRELDLRFPRINPDGESGL